MQAGTLRHLVVIQKTTHIVNSFNEQIDTPVEFAQVWASVRPLTGSERVIASQTAAKETTVFGMRYLRNLTAKMTILFDGNTYNISSIQDKDARKRELTIYAQSSVT